MHRFTFAIVMCMILLLIIATGWNCGSEHVVFSAPSTRARGGIFSGAG